MADVTLTDDEREALVCDCHEDQCGPEWCPFHTETYHVFTEKPAAAICDAVERIVAARMAAVLDDMERAAQITSEGWPRHKIVKFIRERVAKHRGGA